MKKLSMSIIKKRMAALGLAAMMVVGVNMPAYAYDTYHMDLNDFTNENIDEYYMSPGSWFGEYEVMQDDGTLYRLNISPYWDAPDVWLVSAVRFLPNQSFAAAMYSGYVYAAPTYKYYHTTDYDDDSGYTATVSVGNSASDPDAVISIGWNPTTDEIFVCAEPTDTRTLENDQMVPESRQGLTGNDAFARSTDMLGYKKINNTYAVRFTGWTGVPNWYDTWLFDPSVNHAVTWDIQQSTPDGQPPVTGPAPQYDDSGAGGVG